MYLSPHRYSLGAATPEYFVVKIINCGGGGFAINDCGDKRAIRKSPDPEVLPIEIVEIKGAIRKSPDPGMLPIEILETKTHQFPATDGF